MNEIKQAVKSEDWDRVIELAQKAKEDSKAEQSKKIKDAIADPAKISLVIEGRNGHVVTHNFPIETSEQVHIDYQYDRAMKNGDLFDYRYITSVARRVNINISIKPKSSG